MIVDVASKETIYAAKRMRILNVTKCVLCDVLCVEILEEMIYVFACVCKVEKRRVYVTTMMPCRYKWIRRRRFRTWALCNIAHITLFYEVSERACVCWHLWCLYRHLERPFFDQAVITDDRARSMRRNGCRTVPLQIAPVAYRFSCLLSETQSRAPPQNWDVWENRYRCGSALLLSNDRDESAEVLASVSLCVVLRVGHLSTCRTTAAGNCDHHPQNWRLLIIRNGEQMFCQRESAHAESMMHVCWTKLVTSNNICPVFGACAHHLSFRHNNSVVSDRKENRSRGYQSKCLRSHFTHKCQCYVVCVVCMFGCFVFDVWAHTTHKRRPMKYDPRACTPTAIRPREPNPLRAKKNDHAKIFIENRWKFWELVVASQVACGNSQCVSVFFLSSFVFLYSTSVDRCGDWLVTYESDAHRIQHIATQPNMYTTTQKKPDLKSVAPVCLDPAIISCRTEKKTRARDCLGRGPWVPLWAVCVYLVRIVSECPHIYKHDKTCRNVYQFVWVCA